MKHYLSLACASILLLAFGSLAVLARPGAAIAPEAAAQVESNLQTAAQPAAPAAPSALQATNKVNVIALPLVNSAQFVSASKSFDADGLASLVGGGVTQVLSWNASTGRYRSWNPVRGSGDNFPLAVGGVYRLVMDRNFTGTGVSFVGDVPPPGSVTFELKRPLLSGCIINDISIPLNLSNITNADGLAAAVGNVSQVLEWNAATQRYRTWNATRGTGDNFGVKIGYPYRLCLLANGAEAWP